MFAGLGAAIMGQLGPQAVIPEEAVTVPAAFTVGLKLGGGFGAAEQAAILEGGSAYREFIHLTDVTGQPDRPTISRGRRFSCWRYKCRVGIRFLK